MDPDLATAVLSRWGLTPTAPGLLFLDQLVAAYTRHVPWESAFRIVKRAGTAVTDQCPRWPDEFWRDNLERGGGGTCFESNYAFFRLLHYLGFDGYLTINNMGDSIGCHSAIIIWLTGRKWLVDAGLPLYAPLPVSPNGVMHRATRFMQFTVRPDGAARYQIERSPHPQLNAFTLIDQPVPDPEYRARTIADYGRGGLFLDKVIINKVVADLPWRFNSQEHPWRLNRFAAGERTDFPLNGEAAAMLADHFGLATAVVAQALALTT